ncbi:MAG: hypothetical protein CFH28_00875 [Alphaproteobacteria bacterium MarineAlpha6_Bin6]|nr:MAG: hypothetical protein CFH28_00875 [Alphaproteobacteria bacterium MarineAlpha6_Bin6]PPR33167.1 MAG: hypothetical protein CFH27_00859 [Alphaproteobacteria bacterium MarineAlpha6_Bin5]|tara:strand:- start:70 stop:909 length:840 start_codon:yes stop_codon:yes gene_type:complete
MIKNLFNKLFQFFYATNKSEVVLQSKLRQEINFIKKREFERDNKNLIPFGYKVFSQTDEDGIINEIFKRIGTTNKQFLEFGVNTDFNNTTYLLFNGWKGVWLESSKKKIIKIEEKYSSFIKNKKLKLFNKIITAENVNEELKFSKLNKNLDLLSIDIDGNELYVLNELKIINPRVIIVEYNAKFPPPVEKTIKYDPKFIWDYDDYFGSSLQLLENTLKKIGYVLVGCNALGVNAFFIKKELVKNKFPKNSTAQFHYQEFRIGLNNIKSSHINSNKWLNE